MNHRVELIVDGVRILYVTASCWTVDHGLLEYPERSGNSVPGITIRLPYKPEESTNAKSQEPVRRVGMNDQEFWNGIRELDRILEKTNQQLETDDAKSYEAEPNEPDPDLQAS